MKFLKVTPAGIAIFCLLLLSSFKVYEGYSPGDKAEGFKLKNTDGSMVSLKDYEDAKGFIIIFTCNHCPFAKLYEDRIIELHEKYASKGYPVIAINPNDADKYPEDSFKNMKKRAEKKDYPFPYLRDKSQEVAKKYGAKRTPHVFVLNKEDSKLMVKYTGAIDDNSQDASKVNETYVQDAVNALINGKEVPVKEAKAVGCTIKWKNDN